MGHLRPSQIICIWVSQLKLTVDLALCPETKHLKTTFFIGKTIDDWLNNADETKYKRLSGGKLGSLVSSSELRLKFEHRPLFYFNIGHGLNSTREGGAIVAGPCAKRARDRNFLKIAQYQQVGLINNTGLPNFENGLSRKPPIAIDS